MEDKTVNIITTLAITTLIILIIVARVVFELSKAFYLVAGSGISLIFAVILLFLIRRRYHNRRKQLESKLALEGRELRIEYSFLRKVAGVPTKFQLSELEDATENFRTLMGRGASASVFKGVLSDGTQVAVKRIESKEHGEKEFKSEVAAIASVQHKNLVRLIGYCSKPSPGPRFLVYEYIPNGSLDLWIFPDRKSRNFSSGCLSLDLRYRVAIDVARALAYLHHDCRSRILHLDVKPENILLDADYHAIVADFGLSKLMEKDESRVITTIRGTRGYLAPEWLLQGGITEKSDVYSYGMVLLEMIGGRRNIYRIETGDSRAKRKWAYFPKIVNEKVREGKMMDVVDPRLKETEEVDDRRVKRLVYVALWCIQEKVKLRPSIDRVVEMLEGRFPILTPPDTDLTVIDIFSNEDDPIDRQNPGHHQTGLPAFGIERGRNVRRNSNTSWAMSSLSPR